MTWEGNKWHGGSIKVDRIPRSEITVVSWGTGNNLSMRIYLQKAEPGSGVSEWMWSPGNWKSGKLAILPD